MQNVNSSLTAYSLIIEPYCKGVTMIKEACSSSTKKSQLYGNRVLHFILGCSHLIPIVNTIVTLILHCLQKRKSETDEVSSLSLKQMIQYPVAKLKSTTTQESKASSSFASLSKKETPAQAGSQQALAMDKKESSAAKDKKDASASSTPPKTTISETKTESINSSAADANKNFLQAADLMFENRTLGEHAREIAFTEEQLAARHKERIDILKKLDSEWINQPVHYRDGMVGVGMTLLIMALKEISYPERRMAVVKLLIEKGADPRLKGWHYQDIDPLDCAQEKQIHQLLTNTIEKLNALDAEKLKAKTA